MIIVGNLCFRRWLYLKGEMDLCYHQKPYPQPDMLLIFLILALKKTDLKIAWSLPSAYVCMLLAQSCLTLCDPRSVAHQAPLSMGFYRQEYWSGVPLPSPNRACCYVICNSQSKLSVHDHLNEYVKAQSWKPSTSSFWCQCFSQPDPPLPWDVLSVLSPIHLFLS